MQLGDGPKVVLTGANEAIIAMAINGLDNPTSQELAAQLQGLTSAIQRLEGTLNPPPA